MEEKLVHIGEAARILSISIDTIRRWDRAGKLKSVRDEKNRRLFSINELKKLKEGRPLTISEAAYKLGISATTLRRAEKQGLIAPQRNEKGERRYDLSDITSFHNFKEPDVRENEAPKPLITYQKPEHLQSPNRHSSVRSRLQPGIFWDRFLDTDIATKTMMASMGAFMILLFIIALTGLTFLNVKTKTEDSDKLALDKEIVSPLPAQEPQLVTPQEYSKNLFASVSKEILKSILGVKDQSQKELARVTTGTTGILGETDVSDGREVLAALTSDVDSIIFNIPTLYNQNATFGEDVEIQGSLTAPNVIYSLAAGSGVTITGGQNATISTSGGVSSLQSKTGALSLEAGSGISIDGLKISSSVTNTDSQSLFETIAVSGQSSVVADSSTDTLTFVGSGISITTSASGDTITFTGASGESGFTDDGTTVRLTTSTDSVGVGTTSPSAKIHSLATTEQLRLGYDSSNYASFTVSSGGDLTLAPSGSDFSLTGNLTVSGTTTLNTVGYTWPGSDAGASGYVLSSNASGTLSWLNIGGSSSAGAWDITSNVVHLDTSTDNLTIGSTTNLAKVGVDGDTDEIQLLVQGHSTQTNNLVTFENSSGTDLLTFSNSGLLSTSDLTLGLNDTSATISTTDTNENLTLDPNGSGSIYFHGSTYTLSDSGDLTLGGRITFENGEYIANETDDIIAFVGASGGDNTDLYLDVDGAFPLLYSNTDSIVGFDDSINVTGQSDLEGYASIGNGSALDADETLIVNRAITGTAGNSLYQLHLLGGITEASSGTHVTIAPLSIDAITVTNGGGSEAVTNLASLYIAGAPTAGTTPTNGPYAIFVDAGSVRFDGQTVLNAVTYTWPSADGGASQVLSTNASGTLSWINVGAGAGSHWTDGGDTLYVTTTTDDVAIGGADSDSELFFDTSAAALNLNPYGSSTGNTGEIRFQELEANGDSYTGFKAADSLAGNVIYTLPSADATSSNQVLASNSTGTLSWINVSAGAGSLWSQTAGVLYPTTSTDDLAVGGSDSTADFFVADTGKASFTPATTGTFIDFILETEWTTGDLINADFASSTTLTSDVVGVDLDFNTNVIGVADGDLTGVYAQTPALTSSGATTTNYYGFRSGGGALDTTATGGLTTNVNWYGDYIQIPNIDTGEAGDTTSAYGLAVFPGTVTNGAGTENEYAILADGSTGDLVGGDASGDDLLLVSTTNSTKGDIQFHSSSYLMNSTGDLTIGGRLTYENAEYIANETDDIIALVGASGSDNTDLYIDLDGTFPVLYSNTDSTVGFDDSVNIAAGGNLTVAGGEVAITEDSSASTPLSITSAASQTGSMVDVNLTQVSGDIVNIDWTGATTQTGAMTGLDLDFTNVTSSGSHALYGLHINDQVGATGSTEYAIYQEGTNWDYGGYFEDDIFIGGTIDLTYTSTSDVFDITTDSIATGKVFDISADALSSGNIVYGESTSTALTTGDLMSLYWNPGSSTIASSGSSILTLNVGSSGVIDKIFDVQNASSSVFSVGQAQIVSGLPHNFTAAGDVNIAYDLMFTNQTSSFIKSNASLYLEAGESFESQDLGLKTYGSGEIFMDASGGVEIDTGTTSDTALLIDQDDTDATALDIDVANVGGDIINLDWNAATTQTAAITGLDLDFTNLTTSGSHALYGLRVNDQAGATGSTEYGIYVQGTNWDQGIYTEDDITLAAAANLTLSGGEVAITEDTAGNTPLAITGAASQTGSLVDLNGTSVSGDVVNLDWTGATTQTGAMTGLDIDFTNVTSSGSHALYGLHINDQVSATGSTEYALFQEGTNWDWGLYVEDNIYSAGGVNIGNAASTNNLFDDASNGAGSTTMYIGNASINVTASDVRLKENIVDSTIDALSIVNSLQVKNFDWKSGTKWAGRGRATGLIAQEVYEILPQVVDRPEDGQSIWSIEYHHLVPYTIAAIQQLDSRQLDFETRLDAIGEVPSEEPLALNSQVEIADVTAEIEGHEERISELQTESQSILERLTSLESVILGSTSAALSVDSATPGSQDSGLGQNDGGMVEADIASGEATIASAEAVLSAAENLNNIVCDEAGCTVPHDLLVSGKANLYDTVVTGDFSVGLLSINGVSEELGAEVNTPGTLFLQSENGGEKVDFFGGEVIVSKEGNIEVKGIVTAEKFAVFSSETSSTLGEAVLPAGTKKIIVQTTSVNENSKIFVTGRTLTSAPLVVTSKKSGESFTVEIATAPITDVKFDWFIVEEINK